MNSTGKIRTLQCTFPTSVKYLYPEAKSEAWAFEMYQRDLAKEAILNLMGNTPFILIVSDADELPRDKLVQSLREQREYNWTTTQRHFFVQLFRYSFKWHMYHFWDQGFIINDIGLRAARSLSRMRVEMVDHAKVRRGNMSIDELWVWGGWHCTFCFKVTDIVRKLKSYAHTEFAHIANVNRQWIENRVNLGLDVLNRSNDKAGAYARGTAVYVNLGYPICKKCSHLPGYKILNLPANTIGYI